MAALTEWDWTGVTNSYDASNGTNYTIGVGGPAGTGTIGTSNSETKLLSFGTGAVVISKMPGFLNAFAYAGASFTDTDAVGTDFTFSDGVVSPTMAMLFTDTTDVVTASFTGISMRGLNVNTPDYRPLSITGDSNVTMTVGSGGTFLAGVAINGAGTTTGAINIGSLDGIANGLTVVYNANRTQTNKGNDSQVNLNNNSVLEYTNTTGNYADYFYGTAGSGTTLTTGGVGGNGSLLLAQPVVSGGYYGVVQMPTTAYSLTGTTVIQAGNALTFNNHGNNNSIAAGTLTNASFNLAGHDTSFPSTAGMLVVNGNVTLVTSSISGTGIFSVSDGTYGNNGTGFIYGGGTNGAGNSKYSFNTPANAYTATLQGSTLNVGDTAFGGGNTLTMYGNLAFTQNGAQNSNLVFNITSTSPSQGIGNSELSMGSIGGTAGTVTGLANTNLVINVASGVSVAAITGTERYLVNFSSTNFATSTDRFATVKAIQNGSPFGGPCAYATLDYGNGYIGVTLAPLIAGDINADGLVDVADYDIWAANVGATGATWAQGDLNGDGLVDVADYDIWAANVGATAATPEPISMIILAIGGGLVALKRRNG
jgi:hypothetical protein